MKIIGVIPARAMSTRFPNKPLVIINGLPMIIHVAKKVELALGNENTYVATDDIIIRDTCIEYGFKAVLTSNTCKTGTDRICEFAEIIDADIYINIQGDEPLVSHRDILSITEAKKMNPDKVVNGMCNLLEDDDPFDVNIPKILTAQNGDLIYASRAPIPAIKDKSLELPLYKKQVCIYGFNKKELTTFKAYSEKAYAEYYEDIEILRFLDAGIKVLMININESTIAVDVPEDVLKVEQFLEKLKK